jgi:NDP-sugar pyrophosphorylase family protein
MSIGQSFPGEDPFHIRTREREYILLKAMILCAGSGTRLGAITATVPKCMVPLGGVPLLEYTIEWLRDQGVSSYVVNLHYLPDTVIRYFGDGTERGIQIRYSREEEVLGTAGGVKNVASEFVEDSPFLIWFGDNLSHCDVRRMETLHRQHGGLATIAIYQREDPSSSGVVEFDDRQRITRFREKPGRNEAFSKWVNAGIMICEPRVLELIPQGFSDFGHDVLPRLLEEPEGIFAYSLCDDESLFWIDTPQDLVRVQDIFSEGKWPEQDKVPKSA